MLLSVNVDANIVIVINIFSYFSWCKRAFIHKKRRVKGMCVFICECASFCASIFCLQGVFMNTFYLWNVIYIFSLGRMLMRAWAVKMFCQCSHLFPSLDGYVSKQSLILFSPWNVDMHLFSLTDLFWVHHFIFCFMRSSILNTNIIMHLWKINSLMKKKRIFGATIVHAALGQGGSLLPTSSENLESVSDILFYHLFFFFHAR